MCVLVVCCTGTPLSLEWGQCRHQELIWRLISSCGCTYDPWTTHPEHWAVNQNVVKVTRQNGEGVECKVVVEGHVFGILLDSLKVFLR